MNHHASTKFWKSYHSLPEIVRNLADENFKLLKSNPHRPSLHFKQVGRFWSARIGIHYRALGIQRGSDVVWFWIGPHSEYDNLISV